MRIPECIEHPEELQTLATAIDPEEWLAVDCEFMREDTYFPQLCLVQLATPRLVTCIDVLRLDDLTPLQQVLIHSPGIKIFHSASQDLETLQLTFNALPVALFDTQIAASLLGMGEQVSYADLVNDLCNIHLSKSQTRTNWARRPLSSAQIEYALADVLHLGALYTELSARLRKRGRLEWLQQECEQLLAHDRYQPIADDHWKRIKGAGSLQGQALYRLAQIADWRERSAQRLNRPKQWILSNSQLLELANLGPQFNYNDWQSHRRLATQADQLREQLIQVVEAAETETYPAEFDITPVQRLSAMESKMVKELMRLVKSRAGELNISSSMLANRRSIEQLVRGSKSGVLMGWRREVIGEKLLAHLHHHNTSNQVAPE